MGTICKCPGNTALPSIPKVTCPENLGQIQKVAFQRLYKSTGEKNSMTAEAIKKKVTWTPLLAAGDDTKIVISPYIYAPTNEAGAARTYGGGNATLGGVEMIIGRDPSTFTGSFIQTPQSVIKAVKELQCESYGDNLGVYLFAEGGAIEAIVDGENVYPIPIRSLFIGDKSHGGFENPDSNSIQWSFLPNYSDDLAIIIPTDFNPLSDLFIGEE